jgi:dihydrofolate reductase
MTNVFSHISTSVDGYVAGPHQSLEAPLGEGGQQLHEWAFATDTWRDRHDQPGGRRSVDSDVVAESVRDIGAYVMGRNMFGGGTGPWEQSWRGWWGEDPPFGVPVFVVTHHPRAVLELEGGNVFEFVTDGVEAAVAAARQTAGEQRVAVIGGASIINQCLAAGLIAELQLHVTPIVLGGGSRLFDGVSPELRLEVTDTLAGDGVTHVTYRVSAGG